MIGGHSCRTRTTTAQEPRKFLVTIKKASWNKPADLAVDRKRARQFEEMLLPHLDAAYNLARWLTRNDSDADDLVQESYLRALRSFATFERGRDVRPWLLKIVRNTCYTWLRENRAHEMVAVSEEMPLEADQPLGPEMALIQESDALLVREALEHLQLEYREVLVLREFEELSYKEIAEFTGVPIGTVMSRLSRGRKALCRLLLPTARQGAKP